MWGKALKFILKPVVKQILTELEKPDTPKGSK